LDGEATVKTLKRKAGEQWLLPQNKDYEPIDGTYAQIMGLVVTVIRRL
ncbi:MAG: repressor LexA, partial [Brevibacterium sp.]|nr:repressor LexA [Brevibacterium sp.]